MRRLLVAAAVSLASASQPFSWADAQNAMHACTNGSRPLVDKYAYTPVAKTSVPSRRGSTLWRACRPKTCRSRGVGGIPGCNMGP